MKKIILLLISVLFLTTSCSDFVTDVDDTIDGIDGDKLDDPKEFNSLMNGVEAYFFNTSDNLFFLADGLSDQMYFDFAIKGATFTSFDEIDRASIELDNSSSSGVEEDLHEFRHYADQLIERVKKAGLTDGDALKKRMMFTASFYGAVARYYLGTYFGLTETQGGHAINNSAFLPTETLYNEAIEKFKLALTYTDDETQKRIINSYIARVYLFAEDYSNAYNFALNGMKPGDEAFFAKYSTSDENYYDIFAGTIRIQYVLDKRFAEYVSNDPKEEVRIKFTYITDKNGELHLLQKKYPKNISSIPCFSWQENNLMLAELALQGQSGNALDLVNEVRTVYNLDPFSSIDLEKLYVERDKELHCQGLRLPDQRRFGKFHIVGGWQFLPVSQQERDQNPNLN